MGFVTFKEHFLGGSTNLGTLLGEFPRPTRPG